MYEVPRLERPRHRSWLLLLGWLIAYAVGWAITVAVQETIVDELRSEFNMSTDVYHVVSGLFAGLTLGLPLWLVVRKGTRFWQWMALHMAAWGLAIPGFEFIDDIIDGWPDEPMQGLLVGVLMGGAHYLALRRGYERAIWMLIGAALGWFGALLIISGGSDDATVLLGVTALSGGLPGAALAWILRPRP